MVHDRLEPQFVYSDQASPAHKMIQNIEKHATKDQKTTNLKLFIWSVLFIKKNISGFLILLVHTYLALVFVFSDLEFDGLDILRYLLYR